MSNILMLNSLYLLAHYWLPLRRDLPQEVTLNQVTDLVLVRSEVVHQTVALSQETMESVRYRGRAVDLVTAMGLSSAETFYSTF